LFPEVVKTPIACAGLVIVSADNSTNKKMNTGASPIAIILVIISLPGKTSYTSDAGTR
jgi:hypothetical protein